MTVPKDNLHDDRKLLPDDKPPFFTRWSKLYGWVMLILFILIGLFYLFSIHFA